MRRNKLNTPMYNAMKKHGVDKFTIEEIGGANNITELNYQEWLLIHKFNALWPNGYNMMEGGGSGGKRSKETIRKMSISGKEWHKNNINPGAKKVVNIETGETWESAAKCGKEHNMNARSLSSKLSGAIGNNTPFRYVGQEDIFMPPGGFIGHIGHSKKVVNIETGDIYKSAKEVVDRGLVSFTHSALKSKLNGTIGNNTVFRYLDSKNDKSKKWVGNLFTNNSRKVINIVTREIWGSIAKCEKDNKLKKSYLKDRLSGKCNHTHKTVNFKYLEVSDD